MLSFPEVTEVLRLLTMHLGPQSVLVTAEIHVVDGIDTDGIEDLLERMSKEIRQEVPEVAQTLSNRIPQGKRTDPRASIWLPRETV